MAIDILPYHKVIAHIPKHLRARFTYHQVDIQNIDIGAMQKLLYDSWSISIDAVDHWHASVPCQTYSVAHHNNNYHRDGIVPITAKARLHDEILDCTLQLCRAITAISPHTFLTLENPLGLWADMPSVQACAQLPQWQMLPVAHYCANTGPKDGPFPKKPTCFLVFNAPPGFELAQCNHKCPHRISESSVLHKMVLCRHTYTHPDQHVITCVHEKGKIPLQLFSSLWNAHRQLRHDQKHRLLRPAQQPNPATVEHAQPRTHTLQQSTIQFRPAQPTQLSEQSRAPTPTSTPQPAPTPTPTPTPTPAPAPTPTPTPNPTVIDLTSDDPPKRLVQSRLSFKPVQASLYAADTIFPTPTVQPSRTPQADDLPVDQPVRVGDMPDAPHLRARVQYMAGKTFQEAYGFAYVSKGRPRASAKTSDLATQNGKQRSVQK